MEDQSLQKTLEKQIPMRERRSSVFEESKFPLLLKGVESIQDYAIFLLDTDGRVKTWNEGAVRMEGYTEEEILGKSFDQFYMPEAIAAHFPQYALQQAKEKGQFEEEGWRVRKDGSNYWANVIITPIHNEENFHLGFMQVTRDLTERKLAEEKAKQLQTGINSIIDYAIFMLDIHGKIITWNEGAKRIKGYSEEEIVGQSFAKFYPPESLAAGLPTHLLQEAKEKGHIENEGWRIRKDGSAFWANVVITPIYNYSNQHMGFMKITRDLTERRKAELALARSERNYRTIATHAPNGIFHSDPSGHLIYVNDRACEIMGLTPQQAIGEGWIKAIHPEDKESVITAWKNALQSKESFKKEFRFINNDGKVTWVIGYGRPELDEEEHIKSYIQTVTDINDRKALEEKEHQRLIAVQKAELEQEKRAQEAEENQRRLSELMNIVCHGVRNPMTGLSGNNEFIAADVECLKKLLEEYKSQLPGAYQEILKNRLDDMKEYTQAISECIRQQKEIADSILNLARLEAHLTELNKTAFRPKDIIRSIALSYKGQLEMKKIKLLLELPEEDIIIKSDSNHFTQILSNLLNNAVKFTSAGQINIALHLQGTSSHSYLHVVVKDTGIGMSESELNRIFSPFSQANPRIVQDYGGSGLGLSISKRLVDLLGGTIHVKSATGKGTTFTFTVPCELLVEEERKTFEAQAAKKEETIVELPPKKLNTNLLILLVEDNLLNQKVITRFLEEKGFSYEIANNGKEALEKWKTEKFQLIFMDIKMPEMNGIEATQAIRNLERTSSAGHVSIIGLSADAMEEQKREAYKAGMDDYLVKPYKKEDIYRKIEQWTVGEKKSEVSLSQLSSAPILFSPPPRSTSLTVDEKGGEEGKSPRLKVEKP